MSERTVFWRAFADFSSVRREAAKTEVALKRLRSEVRENNLENARLTKSESDLGSASSKASNDISKAKNSEAAASNKAAAASKGASRARQEDINSLDRLKRKYAELLASQKAADNAAKHANPVFGGTASDVQRLNDIINAKKNSEKITSSQIRAANALTRAQTALKIAQDQQLGVVGRLNAAEERLATSRSREASSATRVTAAEGALSRAKLDSGALSKDVTAAESELFRARNAQLSAARDARDAELGLQSVRRSAVRAGDDLIRAETKIRIATEGAAREFRTSAGGGNIFVTALRKIQGGFDSMEGAVEKGARALVGIRWPLLAGGVYVLLAAISALVSGLFSLGSAIAPAVGGLAAIGPAAFAGAAALGTLYAAFYGVSKALHYYNLSQIKGADQSAKSGKAATNNANQIKDAQHQIVVAQRQELQAQKDLSAARVAAKKNIQDLKNAVIDAALAERGATLDLADAQDNLQKVLSDPTATRSDRDRAQLQVDLAKKALTDSKKNNDQAKKSARDAATAGVSGSSDVKKARQNLADATYAANKAERDYKNTLKQTGAAATSSSSAIQTFHEYLNQLTPAARKFVLTLISMKHYWTDIKKVASANLFPGLESGIKRLVVLFPIILKGVGATARAMGNFFDDFAKRSSDRSAQKIWRDMWAETPKIITIAGKILINFFDVFTTLFDAAIPLTNKLGNGILGWSKNLVKATDSADKNGKLTKFFEHSYRVIHQLGQIAKNLGGIFFGLGKAAGGSGQSLLDSIQKLTKHWDNWVNGVGPDKSGPKKLRDFFGAVRQNLKLIDSILGRVSLGFLKLGGSKSLRPILKGLQDIWNAIKTAFSDPKAGSAFVGLLHAIAQTITELSGTHAFQLFLNTVSLALKVFDGFLQIPGASAVISAIALAFATYEGLKLIGAISGITKLGRAIKGFNAAAREQGGAGNLVRGRIGSARDRIASYTPGTVQSNARRSVNRLNRQERRTGGRTSRSGVYRERGRPLLPGSLSSGGGAYNVGIGGEDNVGNTVIGSGARRPSPGARRPLPGSGARRPMPGEPTRADLARARAEAAARGTRGTSPIGLGGEGDARTPIPMGGRYQPAPFNYAPGGVPLGAAPGTRRRPLPGSGARPPVRLLRGQSINLNTGQVDENLPGARPLPGSGARRRPMPGEPLVPPTPLDEQTNRLIGGTNGRLGIGARLDQARASGQPEPRPQGRLGRFFGRFRSDRGSSNAGAMGGGFRLFGRRAAATEEGGARGSRFGRGAGVAAGLGIGIAGGALGDLINDHRGGARQAVGGAISGAASGAMLGAMFGPEGLAIGAGIGGIVGLLQNSKLGATIAKWWKNTVFPMIKRLPHDFVQWGKDLLHWIEYPFVTAYDFINQKVMPIGAILKHIFDGISGYFKGLFTFWKDLFQGTFDILKGIFTLNFGEIWTGIKKIWDGISAYLNGVWTLIKNLAIAFGEYISKPFELGWNLVKGIFTSAWDWIYGFVKKNWPYILAPLTGGLSIAISLIKDHWGTIKRVFSDAYGIIKTGLGIFVDGLGTIWDKIEKIFGTPVWFVIDVIINKLIAAWDWVANKIGFGHIDQITWANSIPHFGGGGGGGTTSGGTSGGGTNGGGPARHFAGGGVIPGYMPGKDIVPAMLSPGEGILRPEVVRYLGADTIHKLNSDASRGTMGRQTYKGIQHFAGGGIVSSLVGQLSGLFSHVKDEVSGPISAFLSKFITPFGKMVGHVPLAMLKKLAGALTGKLGHLAENALGAVAGPPGQPLTIHGPNANASRDPAAVQAYVYANMLPKAWKSTSEWDSLYKLWSQESGWRWNATGKAVPVAGLPGLYSAYGIPQSLPGYKMASAGSDWQTNPYTQIKWGLNYIKDRYGDPNNAWGGYWKRGGWYAKGGIVPGVQYFNSGGTVKGLSTSDNNNAIAALWAQSGLGFPDGPRGWSSGLTEQLKKRLAGVSTSSDVANPSTQPSVQSPLSPDSAYTTQLMNWVSKNNPNSYWKMWTEQPHTNDAMPNAYHRNPLLPLLSYLGGTKKWKGHSKSSAWSKDITVLANAATKEKGFVSALRGRLGVPGNSDNDGLFSNDMQNPMDHAAAHALGVAHPADWQHPWSGPVTDVEKALAQQERSNSLTTEWYKDLNILAGWGDSALVDYLLNQGISEGMVLLRSAVKDETTAKQLNESITAGNMIGGGGSNADTILHIIAKLASGTVARPFGLRDVSSDLNVPDYSVVNLFDAMTAQLSTLPTDLTSRFENDVSLFRQGLFYAATGGIVPGNRSVNRDVQPAMLTPGEGVLTTKAMSVLGESNLHRLNNGMKPQMFANGGVVLSPTFAAMGLGTASLRVPSGHGSSEYGSRGGPQQVIVDVDINNPTGENSIYSMTKALQTQAHLGTIAKLTGNK